jgi:hypothetical protein
LKLVPVVLARDGRHANMVPTVAHQNLAPIKFLAVVAEDLGIGQTQTELATAVLRLWLPLQTVVVEQIKKLQVQEPVAL